MYKDLFSKNGLSFERLTALLEIAEAGSISRAVGGDPVRQSLYSRQVKELESFFGVELTRRNGQKLMMTEAGEELVRMVREQFIGLLDFKRLNENQQLNVNIGAGDSLLHWVVIPALSKLETRFPNISASLKNLRGADIVEGLGNMTIDLGLLRPSRITPPLKCLMIGTLEYGFYVPARLFKKGATAVELLSKLPMAIVTSTSFGNNLKNASLASGFSINVRLHCQTFPEAAHALKSGEFTAILPKPAEIELDMAGVKRVKVDFLSPMAREIAIAWNPRLLNMRPAVQRYLEALSDLLVQHKF